MNDFTIYPAIDLRSGQVVRLKQGDPNRQTVYGNDPAGVAQRWLAAGACWLHIVNLDGAFGNQDSENLAALQAILDALAGRAQVQFGGGLRSLQEIDRVLRMGVSRAIVGTAAIENPDLVQQAINKYGPERVGVGIDARDDQVRVRGWQEGSSVDPITLAQELAGRGAHTVVYTNIARDGVGTGVDVVATQALAEATGLEVIASGGVASAADVEAVRSAGLPGVIIGRALYEGAISLENLIG